jgi:hypothetical protein
MSASDFELLIISSVNKKATGSVSQVIKAALRNGKMIIY